MSDPRACATQDARRIGPAATETRHGSDEAGQGVRPAAVSVILPVFNSAETVSRALRTALEQTRPPAEIVVIDDASTDGSHEIVERCRTTMPADSPTALRLIRLPRNAGVYVARNAGWEAATQPYLAFLDADDYWHPDKLARQFAFLERDPELFLCCHEVRVRERDPGNLPPVPEGTLPWTRPLDANAVLWKSKVRTISVVMRNSPDYRFDESKRRSGDTLLWTEIVLDGRKTLWLDETLGWKAKAHFGAGGLSGNLWMAEMENQHTLRSLAASGRISGIYASVLRLWALARLGRRACVVLARQLACAGKSTSRRPDERS